MKRYVSILSLVCLLIAPTAGAADRPFVPSVFADGMVLQRDAMVPVWGFAAQGTKVTVKFAGQTVDTTADPSGRWTAKLAAMPATYEGRALVIESPGIETRTINDVLVGDVYLLAGQSNMSWPLRAAKDDTVLAAASYPWLRVFMQADGRGAADQPNDDVKWGKWKICTPETAGAISGVGFHFARALHESVDVPIALVHTAVGGTKIECWIDSPTLKTIPTIQNYFDAVAKAEAKHADDKAKYKEKIAEWEKTKQGRRPDFPNMLGADRERRPSALFNGLVAPLQPMALRGVIWYQGEGNASNNPTHYRNALRTLIESWRRDFNQPELSFLIVQLPNWAKGDQWPGTREAQRFVAQNVPHTGLIVTLDIGVDDDLHPPSKVDVGVRAARLARAMIYGQDVVATGPIAASAKRSGDSVVVKFDHVGGGLAVTEGDVVKGFEVREGEGKFRKVEGRITSAGEVTLDGATGATAVRYAWAAVPSEANLRNSERLPAATFLLESIEPAN